ncbi:MAG: large conductance mechanosensitive channel protein MscL [Clostridia bacterium]|nr:large conductance mechanosensitive channel protein MscL [Clostridia bacterium]
MKKLLKEFKEFAMRGSVIDLAVGVVIGAAFGKVVTAVVDIFITPLVEKITANAALKGNPPGFAGSLMTFLGVVVEFLLTALVLFLIIKAVNKAKELVKKPEEPAAPTTKKCPFCCTEIDIEATRCPNCTSELQFDPAKK